MAQAHRQALMSEVDLHASIAEFLDWALLPPAIWTTFPSGWGKLPPATAGQLKRCGLKAGLPDGFVFYDGRTIGLEFKVPGNRPSVAQQAMFHQLREAGVPVFICESIEDVAWRLRELDVPLRRISLWHEEERRERRRLQHDEISEKLGAGESDGPTS